MAKYKLRIKKSAAKELEAISRKSDRKRIVSRIQGLADNPRPDGCKKLSGLERYRIRQGPYRVVYSIEDEQLVVYVVKIGDRKSVYRAP
ncbi:MAG: type II toxin-antitoxin system RelE/ParE family toxin [Gammaproteobacteria bacterium]|nr:type II toxin-antitoxin system mRNA interferase toxin, RelE/StbE family [Chromatiales bacterium]MDP6673950.1 type II toxin-antitoxin system RelE/ParE family toxin [Gammaproteobacteria bacterium]